MMSVGVKSENAYLERTSTFFLILNIKGKYVFSPLELISLRTLRNAMLNQNSLVLNCKYVALRFLDSDFPLIQNRVREYLLIFQAARAEQMSSQG